MVSSGQLGAARDGAGVRWRLRSSLTHLGVRSLWCSGAAFAGTVRRHARQYESLATKETEDRHGR
jgi:hypothetical protein